MTALETGTYIHNLLAEIQDLRAQLADRTAEVKDLDRALEQAQGRARLNATAVGKLVHSQNEADSLRQELLDAQAQLASERKKNERLVLLRNILSASLTQALDDVNAYRGEIQDLRSQRDALLSANDELRRALGVQS